MATALELTREGWQPYIEAASRRPPPAPLSAEEQQEREILLARVRTAAATLRTQFSARRVVLFGSLTHPAWFVPDSDVDLAVEGLENDAYWQAWGVVEDIIGDRPVDLVDIESAGETLRYAIDRHGVEL